MLDADALSAAYVGVVKFQIRDGKTVLLDGQFKVAQVAPGAFAVDHDWLASAHQIYWDADQHPDNPALQVATWVKGGDCSGATATLSFNGKAIGDAPEVHLADTLRTTGDLDAQRWSQCAFEWASVKPWVNGDYGEQARAWHVLDKHPGTYEVAFSRGGKLRFAIDAKGLLVNTGAVEASRRGYRMLVDKTAFYGASGAGGDVKAMYAARHSTR